MASLRRLMRAQFAAAALLSGAGAAHAAVNARRLSHLEPRVTAGVAEGVTVLVPARDEAANIAECVRLLREQAGLADMTLRVLDDGSTDDTARIARGAAAGDRRVDVVVGTDEPPPGWLGKPWACHRLAADAPGSVLVFVDADVRLDPAAIAAGVTELRRRGLHLLSAWPLQRSATPLARLVQPLQQWSWLTTLPLGLMETAGHPQLAAANGQFLVMDAAAYRASGGHESVRGEVLDDIELARSFKRHGMHAGLADASAVANCLMYRSDGEVVAGYSKSLWRAFGGPRRGIAAGAALAAIYSTAPLGLFSRDPATRRLAALGYGAGLAGRAVAARATGGRTWPDSALQPLSAAAFAALTVLSARRHRRGHNRWRGRPVVAAPDPAAGTLAVPR